MRDRLGFPNLSTLDSNSVPITRLDSRAQFHSCHGADRGQRFTAKPQSSDLLQIVEGRDLAGGMAIEGQQRILTAHPESIIDDSDPPLTALLELDSDGRRCRVQSVLEQLLDHGRWTLHDLSSRNLADQTVVENLDGVHGMRADYQVNRARWTPAARRRARHTREPSG